MTVLGMQSGKMRFWAPYENFKFSIQLVLALKSVFVLKISFETVGHNGAWKFAKPIPESYISVIQASLDYHTNPEISQLPT